jgi:hypothetical protein
MKKLALANCVALGLLSAAACDRSAESVGGGAQIPSSQQGVAAQTSFSLVDRNSDGTVSRDEASTVADLDFAAADANGNDQLSAEEYRVAMEARRPRG